MTTRLTNWGQIAEIISSIAVVATLLFLILEIRQNTDLVRTTMFESQVDAVNAWRQSLAENRENRELYLKYSNGEIDSLSRSETFHLGLILNSLWSTYERAFLAYSRELVGVEEWRRFERQVCIHYLRDPEFWENSIRKVLVVEFQQHVLETCESDA